MKVIHLSDLHIGIGSVMGSNPVEHLRSAFSLSGNVHGVPLAAPRSVHEPLWPYLEGQEARFVTGPLERNYTVCSVESDTTIIHTVDYEKYGCIRFL